MAGNRLLKQDRTKNSCENILGNNHSSKGLENLTDKKHNMGLHKLVLRSLPSGSIKNYLLN